MYIITYTVYDYYRLRQPALVPSLFLVIQANKAINKTNITHLVANFVNQLRLPKLWLKREDNDLYGGSAVRAVDSDTKRCRFETRQVA